MGARRARSARPALKARGLERPGDRLSRRLPSLVARHLLRHRASVTTVANLAVATLAYIGAYAIRFDLSLPEAHVRQMLVTLPAAMAIQYAAFHAFKLTRGWWRYVGVTDFINAVKASFVSMLGMGAFVALFLRRSPVVFPRSILLLDFVLAVGLSIGMRLVV